MRTIIVRSKQYLIGTIRSVFSMPLGAARSVGRILGIYLAFLAYFGGVFLVVWYGVPTRFGLSDPGSPFVLFSAGFIGLLGFSYLSTQWRKQTRGNTDSSKALLPSTGSRRTERFEGLTKVGSLMLGVILLVFGLASFTYGLILYGDKSSRYELAAAEHQTYLGPYVGFLTYAPEVVIVSAVCVFILGLWMLVYSRS